MSEPAEPPRHALAGFLHLTVEATVIHADGTTDEEN